MGKTAEYGRRLVPRILDELARDEPDHVLYCIPKNDQLDDGFRDITARVFANAVNRTARWLEGEIGRSDVAKTVAYAGPHDLRYSLVTFACVKTGHTILCLSPRNSLEGQLGVMKAANCTTLVLPAQYSESMSKVASHDFLTVLTIPEQDYLLRDETVAEYPYNKSFEEAVNDPLYIVHTSGSTGVPIPIVCTHGHHSVLDTMPRAPPDEDGIPVRHRFPPNIRIMNTAPLFHQLGFCFGVTLPIIHHSTSVYGPSNGIPNLAVAEKALDHLKIEAFVFPPPLVNALANQPSLLERFKDVDFIVTGGGPVPEAAGIKVAEITSLRNLIGSTESQILLSYDISTPKDWKYFRWHPQAGIDMREVAPGLYELWIVKQPDSPYQAIFHAFPELTEYNMRDLYTRHPDPNKADYWSPSGRSDDIIVLGNGEKIQPLDMESIINSHTGVTGSLIIGSGKFQAAAFIELKVPLPEGTEDRAKFEDSVWETVQKANAIAPSHAQIHRNHIMFAPLGKSFLRADKGTIKRRATVELFAYEIDQFYDSREDEYAEEVLAGVDVDSLDSIIPGVLKLISRVAQIDHLEVQDNIFAAGLDSLMVFRVLGALRGVARGRGPGYEKQLNELRPYFVYANATVERLAGAFYDLLHGSNQTDLNGNKASDSSLQRTRLLEQSRILLEKYTAELPDPVTNRGSRDASSEVSVVLTGSTGSLGSHLLDSLVQNPKVRKVICLNRSKDGRSRQSESNRSRGLSDNWSEDRVRFFQADLSRPELGLTRDVYDDLLETTTLVIHNAWPVNFNWDIESFEPHIAGIRNFVEFSHKSAKDAQIFFISSIGSTLQWKSSDPVPEEVVQDLSVAKDSGYGASKLVSELVLDAAAAKSGTRASICRIGQVAGPVTRGVRGQWNRQEWLPTIIATSIYLGKVPSSLGALDQVDWIPVDILSDLILELAGVPQASVHTNGNGTQSTDIQKNAEKRYKVYNVTNPQTAPWSSLVPVVNSHLHENLQIVSYGEWLDALRQASHDVTSATAKNNPGLKLLEFFESLQGDAGSLAPPLTMSGTLASSPTLRGLQAVDGRWMKLWLEQWAFE